MKILLIQAPLGRKEKPVYPLGLSCLASAISDKHQVEVLDANVHSPERILEVIARFIPEVIGFGLRNIDTSLSFDSYFYFNHFPPFVRWIVKHSSKSVRVVGGSGFSLFPREVMEACPEIDLGVILEGEETFPNLLANLNKPETVFGVCYRDGKKIIFTGSSKLPDFGKFPPPLRLIDVRPYQDEAYQLGVQTKRGCNLRCLYCNYPYLNGRKTRLRDPNDVVDEVQM